jgi:hypothetical protein
MSTLISFQLNSLKVDQIYNKNINFYHTKYVYAMP